MPPRLQRRHHGERYLRGKERRSAVARFLGRVDDHSHKLLLYVFQANDFAPCSNSRSMNIEILNPSGLKVLPSKQVRQGPRVGLPALAICPGTATPPKHRQVVANES